MDLHENELLKSPLQQLELQTAKARSNKSASASPTHKSSSSEPSDDPNAYRSNSNDNDPVSPSPMTHNFDRDRDSIYSFDSVSTSGRLLDRLGLENEDLFDSDELAASRFERLSISDINNKSLLGNSLSRNGSVQSNASVLQTPFRHPSFTKPINTTNSQMNLERFPSYKSNAVFNVKPVTTLHRQDSTTKDNFYVKNVPSNVVHPSRNKSVDSFHASISADTASIISGGKNSKSPEFGKPTNPSQQYEYDEYDEFDFNSSGDSIDTKKVRYKSKEYPKDYQNEYLSRNNSIQSSNPSLVSITRNRSVSAAPTPNAAAIDNSSPKSPVTKRSVSDYTTTSSPNGKSADLSPDTRIKLSIQLRASGKHREASYQLQIAASPPYIYIRAMYLYAMALRIGQGVKQNDQNCMKWLCRAVLVNQSPNESFTNKVFDLKVEDVIKLAVQQVQTDTTEIDPIKLYDYYSKLPPAQTAKIVSSIKAQADPMALVYEELGNSFINGVGVDKNEQIGIKCLSISSSRGNSNSMVQLGEIWSTKTKTRKKDFHKASAWYRLSETLGIKSIGNSWIYKAKYLEKK